MAGDWRRIYCGAEANSRSFLACVSVTGLVLVLESDRDSVLVSGSLSGVKLGLRIQRRDT